MQNIVAIHEAGHACSVLAMRIRQAIVEVLLFQSNGEWLGQTVVDSSRVKLAKVIQDDCDFAKSIAGPIVQWIVNSASVPKTVAETIKAEGFLNGIWWIYKNAPGTQLNWHSDIKAWLSLRRLNSPQLDRYYGIERAVVQWASDPRTHKMVLETAARLVDLGKLESTALLAIDARGMPGLLETGPL